jgi:hypothetical protein
MLLVLDLVWARVILPYSLPPTEAAAAIAASCCFADFSAACSADFAISTAAGDKCSTFQKMILTILGFFRGA